MDILIFLQFTPFLGQEEYDRCLSFCRAITPDPLPAQQFVTLYRMTEQRVCVSQPSIQPSAAS
jgi:hypothetical protein